MKTDRWSRSTRLCFRWTGWRALKLHGWRRSTSKKKWWKEPENCWTELWLPCRRQLLFFNCLLNIGCLPRDGFVHPRNKTELHAKPLSLSCICNGPFYMTTWKETFTCTVHRHFTCNKWKRNWNEDVLFVSFLNKVNPFFLESLTICPRFPQLKAKVGPSTVCFIRGTPCLFSYSPIMGYIKDDIQVHSLHEYRAHLYLI